MVYGLAILCVVLILICIDQRRTINRESSRVFIERQQLQSKIDALTEAVTWSQGKNIDLNRGARDIFKQVVSKNRMFNTGWKRDMPATPPRPEDADKG